MSTRRTELSTVPSSCHLKKETWSVSSVDLYSIFKLSEFIQSICKTSCPMTWHFGWALSPTVWCHILAVLKTEPSPSYNTGLQPLEFLHCSYAYGNKYKTFPPPQKVLHSWYYESEKVNLAPPDTIPQQKPQILTSFSLHECLLTDCPFACWWRICFLKRQKGRVFCQSELKPTLPLSYCSSSVRWTSLP